MKKLNLIVCFFAIILFSCGKKGGTGEQTGTSYIRGTVDGAVKDCTAGLIGHIQKINADDQLSLNGRYGSTPPFGGFDINIYPFKGAGTYVLTPSSNSTGPLLALIVYRSGKKPEEDYLYSSAGDKGSGKLVVTSFSTNVVTGTFEFTGANNDGETETVSKGEFEVKIM